MCGKLKLPFRLCIAGYEKKHDPPVIEVNIYCNDPQKLVVMAGNIISKIVNLGYVTQVLDRDIVRES